MQPSIQTQAISSIDKEAWRVGLKSAQRKKPVDALLHGQAFFQTGWGTCHVVCGGRLFWCMPMFADEFNVTAMNAEIGKNFVRCSAQKFRITGDFPNVGPFAREKDEPAPDECTRNRRGGGDEGVICHLCWHDAGSRVCLLIRNREGVPEHFVNVRAASVERCASFAIPCEIFAKIL